MGRGDHNASHCNWIVRCKNKVSPKFHAPDDWETRLHSNMYI